MGFFGHLVACRSAPADGAEEVPGGWVPGVHVWRVRERLGPGWEQVEAFVDRLAHDVPGGFLSASVLDSDGALVHIAARGDVDRCWLGLDGVVSHFVLPVAPFDEDGNRLPPEEEAALEAEAEREAAAYADQLRAIALEADAAADACRRWALDSGLEPAPTSVVRAALEAHHPVVEDTFLGLLHTLGAYSASAPDDEERRTDALLHTRALPAAPDARSPAGAEIRYLVESDTANMIHSTVPPGQVNRATVHATVSEFWHVLSGSGQLWRRKDGEEATTELASGVTIDIPVATAFQYRCTGSEPLRFLCVSMPPWPGDQEAMFVEGPWEPTAPDS